MSGAAAASLEVRRPLSVAVAVVALALIAGCGNDVIPSPPPADAVPGASPARPDAHSPRTTTPGDASRSGGRDVVPERIDAQGTRTITPQDWPRWLAALIDRIELDAPTNPPSEVYAFRYRDRPVYYRPPYCCDVQGVVFDTSGNVLCHPDGGLTGDGDGRCPDFASTRSDCARLWSDPRAKSAPPDRCDMRNVPVTPER